MQTALRLSLQIPANQSYASWLASRPEKDRLRFLELLSQKERNDLDHGWWFWGRPQQFLPGSFDCEIDRSDWRFWVVQAGRGFGKTRTGAETVREWAEKPGERILMIAPTTSDVRDVMIEGPSGLMSCYPAERRPVYFPTRHLVQFPSGSIGITRSADEPERLRGPQFTKFWADELCAWNYPQEAWDQIQFGFRLKTAKLRGLITTTPRPIKVFQEIVARPSTVVTRGSSYDNRENIAADYYKDVIEPYEGTRLGRQEINAELLLDVPGALWTRKLIDAQRIRPETIQWDRFVRIVIAVDPAVTSGEQSDETGMVAVALTISQHLVVLDDLSGRDSPIEWGTKAVSAYSRLRADRIIGESNNGGDLVERNVRTAPGGAQVAYRKVTASRGKQTRAEPVSSLYERGLVHHAGSFTQLEDEMCNWVPGMKSPSRMDALVWAITALVIDPEILQHRIPISDQVEISPI